MWLIKNNICTWKIRCTHILILSVLFCNVIFQFFIHFTGVHSIAENVMHNLYFQARKYGYVVEVCEPNTAWRLKASQLAKYSQFYIVLFEKLQVITTDVVTEQTRK